MTAIQAAVVKDNQGHYKTFIPPTEHNIRVVTHIQNDMAEKASKFSPIQWVICVGGTAFFVSTIVLIFCVANHCFKKDLDAPEEASCNLMCSTTMKTIAIISEIIGGIIAISTCCFLCKGR